MIKWNLNLILCCNFVVLKVCLELEKEKENDTEDVKKKRFDVILALMQDMQSCGQPPEDLVGDQVTSPFDGEGAPAMPALPPGLDQENCSIMWSIYELSKYII